MEPAQSSHGQIAQRAGLPSFKNKEGKNQKGGEKKLKKQGTYETNCYSNGQSVVKAKYKQCYLKY